MLQVVFAVLHFSQELCPFLAAELQLRTTSIFTVTHQHHAATGDDLYAAVRFAFDP